MGPKSKLSQEFIIPKISCALCFSRFKCSGHVLKGDKYVNIFRELTQSLRLLKNLFCGPLAGQHNPL